jgi:hypothetical protein
MTIVPPPAAASRDPELGQQEGAGQVDIQDPGPFLHRHLRHRLRDTDSRVGPKQIQLPECVHSDANRMPNVAGPGRVTVHEDNAAPPGGYRRGYPLTLGGVGVDQHQGRPLGREQLRTSRADAAGRASNQPGPAAEPPIRRRHWPALSGLMSVTSQRRRSTATTTQIIASGLSL